MISEYIKYKQVILKEVHIKTTQDLEEINRKI